MLPTKPERTDVFWGEIAPSEHLLQIYEDDNVFLDALEGFVLGGIRTGDGVITIATAAHQAALDERLAIAGVDIDAARARGQYISVDAEATLQKFMVDGWPDDQRFKAAVSALLNRAKQGSRRVRAFGEMVALLWACGHSGATVRLEHLWEQFCMTEGFSLFCAYPKAGFTKDAAASIREICAAHSHVLAG